MRVKKQLQTIEPASYQEEILVKLGEKGPGTVRRNPGRRSEASENYLLALRILEEMRGQNGFIFNLGHGVTPDAKIKNIELEIDNFNNRLSDPDFYLNEPEAFFELTNKLEIAKKDLEYFENSDLL